MKDRRPLLNAQRRDSRNMKRYESIWLLLLLLFGVGCGSGMGTDGVNFGPASSNSNQGAPNSAAGSHPLVGDAAAFLARSGLLGTASLQDRSIGQNRYVVFHARAALTPDDANGFDDVFLRDLRTGEVSLVSVATDGTQGNGISSQAGISANGRYVVFRSAATNLVAGDANGVDDIFCRDLLTKTTTRISVDSSGTEGNGASLTPAVSGDGRYVVFASSASDLVSGDSNGQQDIFLRDTVSATTTLVSRDSAGLDSDGPSFDPAITPSGNFIAFSTEATDVISGGLNGQRQVVRQERLNGKRVLVSQSAGGAQGDRPSYEPSISDDGNLIAFFSLASNLNTDTNTFFDVFVRDVTSKTTTLVSNDAGGNASDNHSGFASISGDGATVAFGSLATNLVAADTNGVFDVFTVAATGGTSTRVSLDSAGSQGNIDSDVPAISQDGRSVIFRSAATNLNSNDAVADDDIYLRDRVLDRTALCSPGVPTPSAWGKFSKGPTTTFGPDFGAQGLAFGDVDGDGVLDLATCTTDTKVTVVRRGVGGGTNAYSVTAGGSVQAENPAFADLDGDGDLDLVTTNVTGKSVSVLKNNGAGLFGSATIFAVGSHPQSVVVGDVDGDGDLDLVTDNTYSGTVSVLYNNGTGTFPSSASFATGDSPSSLALGDMDGDGDLDVATTIQTPDQVSILLNDGSGTFGSPTTTDLPTTPYSITLGDVDGDGDLDVATANVSQLSLLLNAGDGSLGTPTSLSVSGSRSLLFGDVDGDGDLDLAAANVNPSPNVKVLLNDGGGSFGTPTYFGVTGQDNRLAIGDLDGDGDLDLGACNLSFKLLTNNGHPRLGPAVVSATGGTGARDPVARDFNGDGYVDVLTVNAPNVSLFANDGTGALASPTSTSIGPLFQATMGTAADFDGDGDIDVFIATDISGSLTLLRNDGLGAFTVSTVAHPGTDIGTGTSGDFDGDGDMDAAFTSYSGNQVIVLLNDGTGTFTASSVALSTPIGITSGDFTGDGKLDLAVSNYGAVHLLTGDGTGSFAAPTPIATGIPFSETIQSADLDKDGDLDLAVAYTHSLAYLTNRIAVLSNDGSGTFSRRNFQLPDHCVGVTIGDLGADGKLDLVAGSFGGSQVTRLVAILRGLGAGLSALFHPGLPVLGTDSGGFILPTLSDLNGDGANDLVQANRTAGTVTTRLWIP